MIDPGRKGAGGSRPFTVALFVLCSLVLGLSAQAQEARIEWRTTFEAAAEEAKASGKSVLICWRIPT